MENHHGRLRQAHEEKPGGSWSRSPCSWPCSYFNVVVAAAGFAKPGFRGLLEIVFEAPDSVTHCS